MRTKQWWAALVATLALGLVVGCGTDRPGKPAAVATVDCEDEDAGELDADCGYYQRSPDDPDAWVWVWYPWVTPWVGGNPPAGTVVTPPPGARAAPPDGDKVKAYKPVKPAGGAAKQPAVKPKEHVNQRPPAQPAKPPPAQPARPAPPAPRR